MTSSPLDQEHVKTLAYALENTLSEALGEDEVEEAFRDAADQWSGTPDYARKIQTAWLKTLDEAQPEVTPSLISDWARQGHYPPDEALNLLQAWYRKLDPLWTKLG